MSEQLVLEGDALGTLPAWEDGYFDCMITSPPYWGLRLTTIQQYGILCI